MNQVINPQKTEDGTYLISEEITRQVSRINDIYLGCTSDDIWNKAKMERPSLIKAIFEASDKIDEEYNRYKAKKSDWLAIEIRINEYFGSWQKLYEAYK